MRECVHVRMPACEIHGHICVCIYKAVVSVSVEPCCTSVSSADVLVYAEETDQLTEKSKWEIFNADGFNC